MLHFTEIGTAWRVAGFHSFTTLPKYCTSEWTQYGPPEYNHVYPDEPNPTNKETYRVSQLVKRAPQFKTKSYNNNNNRGASNNSGNRHKNNKYNGNKPDNNQNYNNNDNDFKRSRSESKQYISAIINSVSPQLLPVRLYLNIKGRTVPTVVITTMAGVLAQKTDTVTSITPDIRPMTAKITGTPEPETTGHYGQPDRSQHNRSNSPHPKTGKSPGRNN